MDPASSVSRIISPDDTMWEADRRDLGRYMAVGREALDLLKRYGAAPRRILDFGCGHGRVLRHIVAEWPRAETWGCDLDPDAVAFCEQAFGVRGIVSAPEPEDVDVPRCDLIWVGSVFTHLEPVAWQGFLRLLAEAITGTLVLSLQGPYVAKYLQEGGEMGIGDARDILADFNATGFAYREYLQGRRRGYGLTLVAPERAQAELEAVGLDVIAYEQRAWMAFQDVVVARPRPSV